MPMPGRGGGIISCQLPDVQSLYASYMPFIKNGALFVQTNQVKNIGDDVFVAVSLPDNPNRMPLNGKVVWVNHRASGRRPAGFAVQLGTDEGALKIKSEIIQLLSSTAGSEKPTYTL